MNSKTVLLCYESKEEALAKVLEECIVAIFDKKIEVITFSNTSKNYEKYNWGQEPTNDLISNTALIFVLCSPFSIWQPWVNFVSGAVTIKIEKLIKENQNSPNYKPPKIIPICHSGQKSKDLPQYLLSRQAMELQHPLFTKKMALTLARQLEIDEPPEKKYSGSLSEDFINKITSAFETNSRDKLGNISSESKQQENKGEEKDKDKDKAYVPVCLVKNADDSICVEPNSIIKAEKPPTEKEWLEIIKKMNSFLKTNDSECPNTISLAIGVQNCLFDGQNIYVGIRMQDKSNTEFLSNSNGEFNTGYKLLRSPDELSGSDFEEKFNFFQSNAEYKTKPVTKEDSPHIYNLISQRLEAFGAKLWTIKLPNITTYIASIFINNSRYIPRFEIGIWQYIDISKLKNIPNKEFIIENFGEDKGKSYWIWVKNGEIFYWSFSEEKLIPRHISPKPLIEEKMKSVLVGTENLIDNYGRLEKYTPFVSDEDLIQSAMVKSRFSVSASALLSCF